MSWDSGCWYEKKRIPIVILHVKDFLDLFRTSNLSCNLSFVIQDSHPEIDHWKGACLFHGFGGRTLSTRAQEFMAQNAHGVRIHEIFERTWYSYHDPWFIMFHDVLWWFIWWFMSFNDPCRVSLWPNCPWCCREQINETILFHNLSANFNREICLLFWFPNSSLGGISIKTTVVDLPQQQWQMKGLKFIGIPY